VNDFSAFLIACLIVGIAVAVFHTRIVSAYHREVSELKSHSSNVLEALTNDLHELRTRLNSAENSLKGIQWIK
jgi:hypothetical protein